VFSRTQPRTSNRHGSWWQRLKDAQAVGEAQAWIPQAADVVADRALAATEGTLVHLAVLPTLTPLASSATGFTAAPNGAPAAADDPDAAALGQVVHKALEWLTLVKPEQRSAGPMMQAVQAACGAVSAPVELVDRAHALVDLILSSPELAPWLDPGQLAWAGNEVGLIHSGRSLRIDRLVALDSPSGRVWWVLDYKIQHRPQDLPGYQTQMRQYVDAVSALQAGDTVRAAFITGEGRLIEVF
jgi:ATP-dependent helicase/nuclease subunit A